MTKMLTLFGEDIGKLSYSDLKRERQVQQYLLTKLKNQRTLDAYKLENMQKPSQVAKDKVSLLDNYITHLEALIEEADYWLDRKFEPETSPKRTHRSKRQIREANKIRHRRMMAEDVRTLRLSRTIERDSMYVTWDKERFLLIAADRGYQTENALVADISKELNLDRSGTRLLMEKGRFTWGQVIVLGAMFEMTPREFCDTFLAGYFVNQNGVYRASCENMDEVELLKSAIRPVTVIEVGSDGRPLDEEEWFDD